MTADEAQLTIRAALAAGYTEIKLTGELSKTGMGDGQLGAFAYNTKITKCDLSGVTGWGTSATLPAAPLQVALLCRRWCCPVMCR